MGESKDRRKERAERLVVLLQEVGGSSYYCKFCQRHIQIKDGIYVHDDVWHDPDHVYEGGHHVH